MTLVEREVDGKTVRSVRYRYDEEKRRLGEEGWQLRCDDTRWTWACNFDVPCEPPYDACGPCKKRFATENKATGAFEPCGEKSRK